VCRPFAFHHVRAVHPDGDFDLIRNPSQDAMIFCVFLFHADKSHSGDPNPLAHADASAQDKKAEENLLCEIPSDQWHLRHCEDVWGYLNKPFHVLT
jgi:hypothetical protein